MKYEQHYPNFSHSLSVHASYTPICQKEPKSPLDAVPLTVKTQKMFKEKREGIERNTKTFG
jgi:hypothetical protein